MKKYTWQIGFGLVLVVLSAVLYGLHYLCFHDAHHIFIYLVGDIAFVPVEVLLVTLVIHGLLDVREKRSRLNKLNMAIGVFFSEVGTPLLRLFRKAEGECPREIACLTSIGTWKDKVFEEQTTACVKRDMALTCSPAYLAELKDFTVAKRPFMLALLENPNLLEHESFTDLLWAVFHLGDELAHRDDFEDLPRADIDHLTTDMQRAYGQLTTAWIAYMKHLKESYPYLFSLAIRTNPFASEADARVE